MFDKAFITQPDQLRVLKAHTEDLGFNMASEHLTGALLQVLAAAKPGGRFLELGTGTGVGTAWLLSGMDETAMLVSVETDERVQSVARDVLGSDRRLDLVLEDGAAFLRNSLDTASTWCLLTRCQVNYVIDDLLPQPNWPEGHGVKVDNLMYRLGADPRFAMVPMIWASGVAVLVRRPPGAHS